MARLPSPDEIDPPPDPPPRTPHGEPLLVWGEYEDDALRVRSARDLAITLDALHALGTIQPCTLRLWSAADEQCLAVLEGDDCALYVVDGVGYGTSVGDPARSGAFELVDSDVGPLVVPWSQCVRWPVARAALLAFAERGQLEGVTLDGSLPSQLLALGDVDREAELANRRAPPVDPAMSSLPRKAPHGAWAQRLLGSLVDLQLVELDLAILGAITARTAMLLVEHGDAAQESPEAAQTLANELSRLRGVGALFATGGDLQIALRRTQDAPTMPVDVPFR